MIKELMHDPIFLAGKSEVATDELSLVVALVVAGKDSKPLFMDANITNFELVKAENENGNLILNYKRK